MENYDTKPKKKKKKTLITRVDNLVMNGKL